MKAFSVLVVLLACALTSHAILQTITDALNKVKDTATDTVAGVKDTVTSVKDSVTNAINIAKFGSQFLWDNAFKPSLDILAKNGSIFIDKKFGNLLNTFGKRDIEDSTEVYHAVFEYESAQLQLSYKELLNEFLSTVKTAMQKNLAKILTGSIAVKDLVMEKLQLVLEKAQKMVPIAKENVQKPFDKFDEIVGGLKENIEKMDAAFTAKLTALAKALIGEF